MGEPFQNTSIDWVNDAIRYVTAGYNNHVITENAAYSNDLSTGCNSTAGLCGSSKSNITSKSGLLTNVQDSTRAVTLSFYLAIFVFGLVGNTLVIYVILRLYWEARSGAGTRARRQGGRGSTATANAASHSVSNLYILNLAAADLLFVLTLPFFCYHTYTRDWSFGEPICKLTYAVRETNKYASVMTLVALSVDRCMATFTRVAEFRQTRVGVSVCVTIWALCLAGAGVPQIIYGRLVDGVGGRRSCQVVMPHLTDLTARRAWIYGQLVFGVVVPFTIIAAVNVVLLRRLRTFAHKTNRHRQQPVQSSSTAAAASAASVGDNSDKEIVKKRSLKSIVRIHSVFSTSSGSASTREISASSRREQASRNMARLVMAIVAIFFICQLPYHVIEIISLQMYEIYGGGGSGAGRPKPPSLEFQRAFVFANAAAQVMVFISSGCNPIVYGVFNKNYRNLYRQVLCCIRQQRQFVDVPQIEVVADKSRPRRSQTQQQQRPEPGATSSSAGVTAGKPTAHSMTMRPEVETDGDEPLLTQADSAFNDSGQASNDTCKVCCEELERSAQPAMEDNQKDN